MLLRPFSPLEHELEEIKSELAHTKRKEKELRLKDVCFFICFLGDDSES